MNTEKSHLWGIILAGGAGKRLQDFTKRLYGYPRPKQYCVITGARSMLEHTFQRARLLISPDHLLTVITQSHKPYADEIPLDQPPESYLIQPENRDTGPGLLLPLMKIHQYDPRSTVVTFPSDHFILDNKRFMEYVRHAVHFVKSYQDIIILIGVRPHRYEGEYGWVEPMKVNFSFRGVNFYPVNRFIEKPQPDMVNALHANGSLWNTFVLVGQVSTFLKHFREHLPEVFQVFDSIYNTISTTQEEEAIRKAYRHLPPVNFSKSVLERITEHLYVLEASGIYWSDWGNEQRIRHDVKRFGLKLSMSERIDMKDH